MDRHPPTDAVALQLQLLIGREIRSVAVWGEAPVLPNSQTFRLKRVVAEGDRLDLQFDGVEVSWASLWLPGGLKVTTTTVEIKQASKVSWDSWEFHIGQGQLHIQPPFSPEQIQQAPINQPALKLG
jgi:hypothetical protein